MHESSVLILIPAYNESARIGEVVRSVKAHIDLPVLVINDCSRDDTARLAQEAGALVVSHPFNMGYGAAVQTGFLYACAHGFTHLAQMDGDGQHDAAFLKDILAPVLRGEADYVIGSRFLPRPGEEIYRGPILRRFGSWVLSCLVRLFTGLRVTDPTSGFVAMRRAVIELLARGVYPHDYPDADVIIMLHRKGFRVLEVPVRMFPSSGKSMHGGLLRPLYYAYKMSLSILMTLLRKKS